MLDVQKVAASLDFLANHFVEEPWTIDEQDSQHRVVGLNTKWYIKHNRLFSRFRRSVGWLFSKGSSLDDVFYELDESSKPFWVYRILANISMAKYSLRKDPNRPDYSLREGTVVALWAETGDYLISMQPAVGDKVAKFLRENPDNPYAIEIAEEIQKGWEIAFPNLANKTMYKEIE